MGGLLSSLFGRSDPFEGRVFNIHGRGYAFHNRLGQGGFGAVYSATRDDDLPVAVKVINLQGLPPIQLGNVAESYLNEVYLLSQLRSHSRHVVKIHDFDFEARTGRGFIVMELGNENLKTLVNRLRALNGGFGPAIDYVMIKAFWRQMVHIVGTLHSRSIVHMDLKPENLILFGRTLKIGDLGISRKVHMLGRARYGTPFYSAPEIMQDYAADLRFYGPKADIWSLGAILYYMVYGIHPLYHPFAASPPPGQPPYPSRQVNDALRRTLVLNPDVRADINTLLHHPLTRG